MTLLISTASYTVLGDKVRKILKLLKSRKTLKQKGNGVHTDSKNSGVGEILQFPPAVEELRNKEQTHYKEEEQPDHETVTRWLKLADELLSNDPKREEQLNNQDDRKQA